jgi:hypothetical protein
VAASESTLRKLDSLAAEFRAPTFDADSRDPAYRAGYEAGYDAGFDNGYGEGFDAGTLEVADAEG